MAAELQQVQEKIKKAEELLSSLHYEKNRLAEAHDRSAAAGLGVGGATGAGAAAGLGPERTAAADAAGPAGGTLATATAGGAESSGRATVMARYSVTDTNLGSVFTPLQPRVLVTHRHGSHASWQPGATVKVLVNDVNSDKPRQVECKVLGCHEKADVVFCITDEDLDAPDLDVSVAPGARYLLLGCSNRSQLKPYSVSHGVISTTTPDSDGHIRGDSTSVHGDSGAGCFSETTGKLFAINVGRDHKNGDRAVLVPVASLLALLQTHTGAPALMCDWGPGE